jgi:hypothetical protein
MIPFQKPPDRKINRHYVARSDGMTNDAEILRAENEKLRAEVAEFKHKQNAIEQYIKNYPAGEDADPEMRSFHTAIKNIFAGKYDDLYRPLPPDALP